ncbi:VWA domain-containing protein [bacterium]|nr:VWA domain-containing protein [bacterium]
MKPQRYSLPLILMILLVLVGSSLADGFILPHPYPPPPVPSPIPYPSVKYHHVNVNIDNQVAITGIDQVFINNYHSDIEGTYLFPIPEDAAISKFSMYSGDQELTGEILDKDKARGIYEDIVRRLKDPALLEYMGTDLFKARVYPIPAHGEKRITIEYEEIIRCDAGMCRYSYPLNVEKFSPDPLQEVTIVINIKSQTPIATVYCPTHSASINRKDDGSVEISFEQNQVKPDKDFVIYYTLSQKDFAMNLLTHREKGEDGFFMLMAAPNYVIPEGQTVPKDIVFVFDKSGSMAGEKIEQARKAFEFCINSLNPEDRFNIITFATEVNSYKDELITANRDNITPVTRFIQDISASGGTNIEEALRTALGQFGKSSNMPIIIFLTDGLPTVGEQNIARIIDNVDSYNQHKVRLFVFGVGYDVNTHLLDRISTENGGLSEYVEPNEDIEVKVSNLYTKISTPLLAELSIKYSQVKVRDVYPRQLPDIFKGSQILLLGRFEGSGISSVSISGKVQNDIQTFVEDVNFPEIEAGFDFLPRLWATRKINFLLNEIRLYGENEELTEEIKSLSKQYGIMTPYTSYLVLEDEMEYASPEIAPMMDNLLSFSSDASSRMKKEASGEQAVKTAKALQAPSPVSQEAYWAGARAEETLIKNLVKNIGKKTFYFREDVWVDQEYREEQKSLKVKFDSDAYYSLLSVNPQLGKYLAVGHRVIVMVGETALIIGEEGKETLSQSEMKLLSF